MDMPLSEEISDLADFLANTSDKDGQISRANLTFIYKRLRAIGARAKAMEAPTRDPDGALPPPLYPPHAQD